jgi:hypothetical protein
VHLGLPEAQVVEPEAQFATDSQPGVEQIRVSMIPVPGQGVTTVVPVGQAAQAMQEPEEMKNP